MIDERMVFEYQDIKGVRLVCLDSRFTDYNFSYILDKDGKLAENRPPVTIKDCRYIDGCVYFHKDHVPEFVMNEKIELFQKLLKDKGEGNKSDSPGLVVPDDVKFKF